MAKVQRLQYGVDWMEDGGCWKGLMGAEADTWEKAIELAATLRRLAGPGSIRFPEVGKLLREAGAGQLLPGGGTRRPPNKGMKLTSARWPTPAARL